MTSPENLGQQFIPVFRGLAYTHEPDRTRIGIHWTTNPNVASDFASDVSPLDWDSGHPDVAEKGVILEGKVHPQHEVTPGTTEFEDISGATGALGTGHYEAERTIRPGAPIHITKHHYLVDGKVVRSEDTDYEAKA